MKVPRQLPDVIISMSSDQGVILSEAKDLCIFHATITEQL